MKTITMINKNNSDRNEDNHRFLSLSSVKIRKKLDNLLLVQVMKRNLLVRSYWDMYILSCRCTTLFIHVHILVLYFDMKSVSLVLYSALSSDIQQIGGRTCVRTCKGLMPSPMSSVRGSLALNACISPNIAVPENPASTASASKS